MKKFTFLTRSMLILFAFSILPLIGISQTHFTQPANPGAGNWHIYPVYANLFGTPLEADDEIAVFDGNVCVGTRVLTAALDSTYNLCMANDLIAYETNNNFPGYTPQNNYTWKCWDESAGIEYTGTMVYDNTVGDGNYDGNVFPETMNFVWSFVGLNFNTVAAGTGDISGTIKNILTPFDSIAGVVVTATGATTYTATTNGYGYYLFDGIDEGGYVLTTSHSLYLDAAPASVTVASATPVVQNYSLSFKSGVLEGYVKDQADAPLQNAIITIAGHNGTGTTDIDGFYRVIGIDSGYYDITATLATYAPQLVNNVIITPNDTTDQNFVLQASGTIAGTVSDNNAAPLQDIVVTVVETGATFTTLANGQFSFDVPTGTYSLTFVTDSYHDGATSGIVVTTGNTTNADKTLYGYNWTFTDGDPFSDVWTIYLNTVTGDGTPLKDGDEIAIFGPSIRQNIIGFSEHRSTNVGFADNGGGATRVETTFPHELDTGDDVDIIATNGNYDGVTLGAFDGSYTNITVIDATHFDINVAFPVGSIAAGQWICTSKTQIQSTNHGLIGGESVGIVNTINYDDTYIIKTFGPNFFLIDKDYVAEVVGGTEYWCTGEQMVGLHYLEGPINNEGTNIALKAFSVLSDGSTGYAAGEPFTFKLSYMGGGVLTDLNTTTWAADGNGLTDPNGTVYLAGSPFSKVDMDFDLPPGELFVDFDDENGAIPDANLYCTLYKNGTEVANDIFSGGGFTFTSLDAGDYTLVVTSDRFETATFTGIIVAPNTTTNKNFVVNHFADETQIISFKSGYQLVSRRIGGNDIVDLETNLGSPFTDNNNNWVKNVASQFFLHDIGLHGGWGPAGMSWQILSAYNLYAENTGTITFTGTPIAYNADIAVAGTVQHNGNSMISYLPDYVLDADIAFASLKDDNLDYIRDKEGNSLRKIGGVWVDHIGNCSPGDGFLVKRNHLDNITFNYPAQTKSSESIENTPQLSHFSFTGGDPLKEVFTLYIQSNDLEIGDEIAAYDGSTIVGAIVIVSDDYMDNAMPVFSTINESEIGYTSGNNITLKAWKANEDNEYFMNFTNINEADDKYSYVGSTYPDGEAKYSIVDVTLSPEGIIDNLADYINVYPNPAKGYVTISSPENIERLMLVNLVGQTLIDVKAKSVQFQLNLDGLNSGVYFVNMFVDGQKVTKKLSIQ